jgi:hypothetical protein
MSTTSPGTAPAGSIRDLGLPGRAVTALTRAGITSTEALAVLTRRELAAIPGVGAGMVAAIRLVVPEPPPGAARSGGAPDPVHGRPARPERDPGEQESPAAPAIPSFASLRAPRRRTAMDLLVPEQPPSVTGPAPEPERPSSAGPASVPRRPSSAAGRAPAEVPRPAEYADLLRLGVRLVRGMAVLPGRVAVWSVREPMRLLRRLLAG